MNEQNRVALRSLRVLGAGALALAVALTAALPATAPAAHAAPDAAQLEPAQRIAERTGSIYASGQHEAAIGADGTAAVVWQEANGGGVYVSVREPGRAKWGAPRQLSRWPLGNGKYTVKTAWAPRVSVGADGTIAVSWNTYSGFYASVRPGGTRSWTDPHEIGSRNVTGVTVAPNGAVTAIGASWEGANQLNSFFRPAGAKSEWRSAKRISPKGSSVHEVQVRTSGDGHLALVWTTETGRFKQNVHVSTTNGRSGAWSPVATLAKDLGANQHLTQAIGRGGRMVVAWAPVSGPGGITARTLAKTGASWSAAETVSATPSRVLQSGVTGSGTAILAWQESLDAGLSVKSTTRLSSASAWSAAGSVVGANQAAEFQWSLAAGPGGDAALSWATRAVGSTARPELRVRVLGGGGWGGAVGPISENGATTTWWNSNPLTVLGPSGEMSVFWIRTHDRTGERDHTSQLLVRSTPVPPMALLANAKVRGTPRVGSALTCSAHWSHAASRTTTWRIGSKVVGRAASYTPRAKDRGKRLRCTVVATNPRGAATSVSPASAKVGVGAKLRATKRPAITGAKRAGSTVRVSLGRWSPKATSHGLRWRLNGKKVGGARGSAKTFTVRAGERGGKLSVTVTAKRAGHASGTATSRTVRLR
ncbi:hypothetical protein J4H92_06930 [Leucobacter weissii]|uniref:Ig-like domain-containing protein n=1 Tax=Leucobacter weissii TaxID=1983706 RepID=A0A939MNH1_9MICO|nr:hypothetical protein [Leucobacter weissii]MBO1901686.1 hypothetical protein [Leucobacter weissii]